MTKHRKVAAHHHNHLKEHAKALVNATSHIADDKVASARSKLMEVIESVGEAVDNVEEAVVNKAKQADEYIRENPYKTLGIAAALGALFGMFMARRKE